MFSVIVPTYNERDNVRALLERVLPVLDGLDEEAELLIVDDNSPDGTAEHARAVAADHGAGKRVRAIVRTEDRGLAKAVMEGFRQARGDVVAVMDADLSHPPEVLPDLLAPIRDEGIEITVASRRVPGGGISNWPWTRRFTSWSAALMARPLVSIRDTTSGYFAVRKDLLDDVELRPIGYKIALEALVRTESERVREVPFVFTDRTAGKSKLGGAVMLAYLQQLVGLYRQRIFGKPGSPGTPWRRRALALVWGLALLHLVMAPFVVLTSDEAYYWNWSRPHHLAAGYFDHPPLVAWLIAAGTSLFGTNPLGIRVLTAVLLAGLGWIVFRLTTSLVRTSPGEPQEPASEASGFWAAAALLAMPLISVGGFLTTPDVPLLFFWTATIALVLAAVRSGRVLPWILAGIALGLTALSKYHAILLPIAALIGLSASRAGRRAFRGPGPYLAVLACAAVLVPYARWLLADEFNGIRYQLEHGADRSTWGGAETKPLANVANFLGGQLVFVTPILLAFAAYALLRSRRIGPPARPFLVACAAVPLLLFAVASFKERPEANWPSVVYPSACILLGPLLARWFQAGGRARLAVYAGVGVAAAISLYVHAEMARPTLLRVGFMEKFERLDEISDGLHALRVGERRDAPVLADSYRTASLLAFYLPDRPNTAAPFEFGSGEQFAYWEAEIPLRAGTGAWYVTRARTDPRLGLLFRSHEEVARFEAKVAGEVTHVYKAFWGLLRGTPIPRGPLTPDALR